jgi:hypothetical protein
MINFGGLTTVAVILGGLFVANRNKQKIIEVIDDLRN